MRGFGYPPSTEVFPPPSSFIFLPVNASVVTVCYKIFFLSVLCESTTQTYLGEKVSDW